MYNRYIPSADGTYRRETVAQPAASPVQTCGAVRPPQLRIDTGDLLVLAILLLLLLEGDGSETMTTLIAIAAFLILQ